MSVLKIIAILGILIGIVCCVVEMKKNGKRFLGLFVALIAASAALFFVSGYAKQKAAARQMPADQAVALNTAPAANEDSNENKEESADNKDESADNKEKIAENKEESLDNKENTEDNNDFDLTDEAGDSAANPQEPEVNDQPDAENQPNEAEVNNEVAPDAQADTGNSEAKDEPSLAPAPQPDTGDAFVPVHPEGGILANAGTDVESAKVNEVIAFSAKRSKVPRGYKAQSYTWDFGDGATAEGRDVSHTYANTGKFMAKLTITDDKGQISTAARQIAVNRPEAKIRLASRAFDDLKQVASAPAPLTGTFEKKFEGSKVSVDAEGFMQADDGAKCEIIVSVEGPNCIVSKNKSLSDGGEGDVNVKAVCKGDPGQYSWTVTRRVAKGSCTFERVKIDISEN